MTIQDICKLFDIGGDYISCSEVSTGNINSSFRVRYIRDGENKSYILQKININVFKNPEKLMDNIIRVTDYIRENVKKNGLSTKRDVLRAFLARKDGAPFVVDNYGNYWRCYRFIKDSITYDATDKITIIEQVGEAFGRFQNFLDGFDAKSLYIVIPDFHNTPKRYEAFLDAINKDPKHRASEVKEEIDAILSFKEKACEIQGYLDSGRLPTRVTHNDTKCNNVSFDKNTDEALAVLDLDTVMPGAVAYDFGDAVRSIASTLIEDSPDFDNVHLDLKKYKAFTKGFAWEVRDKLTDLERKTLNLGVFTMTVELAMRFLTDYILGDEYFKTKYPGHNLDRTRNQIALAKDILEKMPEMDNVLNNYLRS